MTGRLCFSCTRQLPLLYGYFAFDRPFAWPYQWMYTVFGLNAVAWHLMTLLMRWAGILFLYLSLRLIWPRYDSYLRWLGALLLVYPGFFQQSISGAYNRHFTAFAIFALSFYLMALAVKHPGKGWLLWPLSWITAAAQVITIEYFVGLELVRILLLWLLLTAEPQPPPHTTDEILALLLALRANLRGVFLVAAVRLSDHACPDELCRRFQAVSGFWRFVLRGPACTAYTRRL